MPRIFDNIDHPLLPALQETLDVAYRADFCVGYFNLRGWGKLDAQIQGWTGGDTEYRCRLLVGMQRRPEEQLRAALRLDTLDTEEERIDNKRAVQLKRELAEEFRSQLTAGAPTNADEAGLRRLAQQLRDGKLVVKLFLHHPLHAKLYLLYRHDQITPTVAYMGSSNLTLAGLAGQGELNIDVVDQDAADKLAAWFEDRWEDRWCVDISEELVEILDESWAGERLLSPYFIYLDMAYHLSREARVGLTEFRIPDRLYRTLFDFQSAAVKIAARHLNQRGGVLIGDVVGLGKTLMATALAKIFEEDFLWETLIICPKNLVKMWESYRDDYHLQARVLPITRVLQELPDLRRFRLVLIDESHNLRNPEGKRYRIIQEYIRKNECRCILLSATPYNKSYLDLSSQLRLFLQEDADLGIRPERLLREVGVTEFNRRYQCPLRSLQAFERSAFADDWRELMSLFMVRRTRSFIRDNYATLDATTGLRYLTFPDGSRAYFPNRTPKALRFNISDDPPGSDPADQNPADQNPVDRYARLYSTPVVDTIDALHLPRYGLGNYVRRQMQTPPTATEKSIIDDLARGGRRLMGFCRTNLFKRLESSGYAFLLSVERHVLRNYVFLHALEHGLPLPIGTQGAEMLDTRFEDEDADEITYDTADLFDVRTDDAAETDIVQGVAEDRSLRTEADFRARAAEVYALYASRYRRRFRWLRSDLFARSLERQLLEDAQALIGVLQRAGSWRPDDDAKLALLRRVLTETHPDRKVLVFSQFADTVDYLAAQLRAGGIDHLAGVTGKTADPTELAWRFSPVSNLRRDAVAPEDELRVLIATDVLSEGQNLQDAAIVVNYDLPWAIIRLIQRAGRVDRIGQRAAEILCYLFWPAEGVERLIRLRSRLWQRLQENAEVVGTDEAFFEEAASQAQLVDLYHERPGSLDDEDEREVDLVSYAYQIWKNATDANPALKEIVPRLPPVVYATKAYAAPLPASPRAAELGEGADAPAPRAVEGVPGVLVYTCTTGGNSALAWIDAEGNSVTESQFAVLRAAQCAIDTPALPRMEIHHALVEKGARHIVTERPTLGGQLGRPSGARFKTYERLKAHADYLRTTFFEHEAGEVAAVLDALYRYPLHESARDTLNRQLRSRITDEDLARLAIVLHQEGRLCVVQDEDQPEALQIICSLGLVPGEPKR